MKWLIREWFTVGFWTVSVGTKGIVKLVIIQSIGQVLTFNSAVKLKCHASYKPHHSNYNIYNIFIALMCDPNVMANLLVVWQEESGDHLS